MTGTSASPVTVREARPEEGPAVAALLRESYVAFAAELPPDLLRGWIDDVLDPGGATTLVALAEGTLAGTARLHLATTYPIPLPGGSVGVRAVAVAPARRRSGVARALMAACAERARTGGAAALYLHTAPFMAAATALYEGLGYRRDPATDIDIGAHFGVASAGSSIIRAPLALPPPVLPRSASAISYDAISAARAVRGSRCCEVAHEAGSSVTADRCLAIVDSASGTLQVEHGGLE